MSFYEKYKRPIMLGVALFALVTFSVTGPMMGVFQSIFAPKSPERITLADGREVQITMEDHTLGRILYQLHLLLRVKDRAFGQPGVLNLDMPAFVFEGLPTDFTDNSNDAFAILRRVAVEQGIDVADEEVRAVLDFACREKQGMGNPQDPQNPPAPISISRLQLARNLGLSSVQQLEGVIREAIRISTLVRTETVAGLDTTDAELASYVGEERKRMTLSYVRWGAESFEDELKRSPPTDPILLAWIEEQPEPEKARFQHASTVSFGRLGILYDQADPADFAVEIGEDFVVGDSDVQARYDQDKETLYKRPEKEKDGEGQEGQGPGGKEGPTPGEKPGDEEDKKNENKEEEEEDGTKKKNGDGKDDENGGLTVQEGGEKQGEQKQGEQKKEPEKKPEEKTQAEEKPEEAPKAGEQAPGPQPKTGPEESKPQGPIGPPSPEQAKYIPLEEVRESIIKKLKLEKALRKILEDARKAEEDAKPKPEEEKEAGGGEKDGETKDGDEKKPDPAAGKDPAKDPAKDPVEDPGKDENGGLLAQQAGGQGTEPPAPEAPAPAVPVVPPLDLAEWFKKISKGRKGLVYVPPQEELLPPEKFQELDDFGQWLGYWALNSAEVGTVYGQIQPAEKGTFFFQLAKKETNVMKDIAEVRDEALEAYYIAEANKKAKEKAEVFRKLVRTKGEELKTDETKELRDSVATKVAEKLKAWEEELQKKIAAKQKLLATPEIPISAVAMLEKEIAGFNAELAKKPDQEKSITETVDEEIDAEIGKLIEPVLAEAFTAAVTGQKIEASTVGPYFKDEASRGDPLFRLQDASPAKFLKEELPNIEQRIQQEAQKDGQPRPRKPKELEKGWVSDPVEDSAGRAWYILRLDDKQDGGNLAVTRRMLAQMRSEFIEQRVRNVLQYGFGLNALRKRYGFSSVTP